MKEFLALAKALADPGRARTLACLSSGELCLCQIIEMLDLAPSTASKHMAVLQQAGLVESRKDGRWVYYRLAGRDAPPRVRQALEWATACLKRDPQVRSDARRLRAVRRMDLAALCTRYRECRR
jgi:DNA-binding transcriptional ArsR family regulator